MTDLISRAAVLDILNTPQSWDTFPDMIRRVEALEGCGVQVKALEWFEAGGNFPTQRVWQFEALQWMWIVQNDGGNYVWCEDVSPSWAPASGVRGVFTTLEAAKAAAQADYEARILAALEVVPLAADPAVRARVEAALAAAPARLLRPNPGFVCECGMTGPCMTENCKSPILAMTDAIRKGETP